MDNEENRDAAEDTEQPAHGGSGTEDSWVVAKSSTLATASLDKSHKPGVHRGYYWVTTEVGFETMDIEPGDVVEKFGVPLPVLKTHLKTELEDEEMVKSLPLALMLVMFFAAMWINHDSAQSIFGVQKAISFDVYENANFAFSAPGAMGNKALPDVNSYADFWSWMRHGLVPLIVKQDRPVSEAPPDVDLGTYSDVDRDFYLWHNRRVGGIRMRQEVSQEVECPSHDLQPIYGKTCETVKEGLRLDVRPERYVIATTEIQADESKTVWIEPGDRTIPLAQAQQQQLALEKSRWLNDKTARIEVSFVTYNGHMDLLVNTNIHLLFARTGHIWKEITFTSIRLDPYYNFWVYVTDILFYSQITWIFMLESCEVLSHVCRHRQHPLRAMKEYWTIWNVVDWLSVIIGYYMLGLWIEQVFKAKHLSDTLETNKECFVFSRKDLGTTCTTAALADFLSYMQETKEIAHMSRQISAIYPAVIIFRLLKAFSAQPRLAVVTRTLQKAFVDLYHFGIAFCAIFLSYSIMGMVLFGRELREFTTLGRSAFTCFRMLMGDFDADSMMQVSVVMVWIYFGSFMVLLLLIMLNMLIAILMDVYSEVKTGVQNSETLVYQAFSIVRRTWQNLKKERVELGKILKTLDKASDVELKEDTRLTPATFIEAAPELKEDQARRLLIGAAKKHHGHNNQPPGNTDVMRSVALVSKHLLQFLQDAKADQLKTTETQLQKLERTFMEKIGTEMDSSLRRPLDIDGAAAASVASSSSAVSAEKLAADVPLDRLIRAAQLRLQADNGIGAWPMAAVSLSHVLDAAGAANTELIAQRARLPATSSSV